MPGVLMNGAVGGIAYFAIVFAAGFGLGVLRVLVLMPRVGETAAVLLELPIILAISWITCQWLVARLRVPATIAARMIMGGFAFALLMTAEFLLGVFGFGRSVAEHVERYRQVPELLGLAGQLMFAAIPVVQLVRGSNDARASSKG